MALQRYTKNWSHTNMVGIHKLSDDNNWSPCFYGLNINAMDQTLVVLLLIGIEIFHQNKRNRSNIYNLHSWAKFYNKCSFDCRIMPSRLHNMSKLSTEDVNVHPISITLKKYQLHCQLLEMDRTLFKGAFLCSLETNCGIYHKQCSL